MRIAYVSIYVNDLEKMKDFFRQVFQGNRH